MLILFNTKNLVYKKCGIVLLIVNPWYNEFDILDFKFVIAL